MCSLHTSVLLESFRNYSYFFKKQNARDCWREGGKAELQGSLGHQLSTSACPQFNSHLLDSMAPHGTRSGESSAPSNSDRGPFWAAASTQPASTKGAKGHADNRGAPEPVLLGSHCRCRAQSTTWGRQRGSSDRLREETPPNCGPTGCPSTCEPLRLRSVQLGWVWQARPRCGSGGAVMRPLPCETMNRSPKAPSGSPEGVTWEWPADGQR